MFEALLGGRWRHAYRGRTDLSLVYRDAIAARFSSPAMRREEKKNNTITTTDMGAAAAVEEKWSPI